jgi:hypothetical protein
MGVAAEEQMLDLVTGATEGARPVPAEQALRALAALRQLRARLDAWEPELIAAARAAGVNWAELAPVLGVASRQAAERRYLRLRRPGRDEKAMTGDERVRAERDRRAGERAVTAWARAHGADLRQLAGQITALTDLGPDARQSLERLHEALGGNDPAALIGPLAGTYKHLGREHTGLAERVTAVGERVDDVRMITQRTRAREPER